MTNNIDKIRGLAQENNLDAIVLNNTYNVRYASGYAADYCYLVVTPNKAYYLTDGRFTIEASAKLDSDFTLIEINRNNAFDIINDCLKGNITVGFESSVLYSECRELLGALNDFDMRDVTKAIERLRAVKSREEIECIIKANEIAEKSLYELKNYFVEGVTERELQARLDFIMALNGSEKVSFDTITAFGENSAHAHAKPGDRKLKVGDIMLFDFGATYYGYHSDMTRCFIYGSASEKQIDAYNAVLKAQLTALDVLGVGKTCAEIDGAARSVLSACEYGEYFTHSLGHGVGLEIHEEPSLSPSNGETLAENAVVTIEPGVYIKGFGGIRIEDMAVVGGEIITKFPKELEIIKA